MITVNVKQSLLNAFNKQNKVNPPIRLDDINWTAPEIFLQGQCNTRITMVAKDNSTDFSGAQTLYYKRRWIGDDLKDIKIPGKSSDYTRLYEILSVLRNKMGVPLYENEFLDRAISGDTVTIITTTICSAYLPADQIILGYSET